MKSDKGFAINEMVNILNMDCISCFVIYIKFEVVFF